MAWSRYSSDFAPTAYNNEGKVAGHLDERCVICLGSLRNATSTLQLSSGIGDAYESKSKEKARHIQDSCRILVNKKEERERKNALKKEFLYT